MDYVGYQFHNLSQLSLTYPAIHDESSIVNQIHHYTLSMGPQTLKRYAFCLQSIGKHPKEWWRWGRRRSRHGSAPPGQASQPWGTSGSWLWAAIHHKRLPPRDEIWPGPCAMVQRRAFGWTIRFNPAPSVQLSGLMDIIGEKFHVHWRLFWTISCCTWATICYTSLWTTSIY